MASKKQITDRMRALGMAWATRSDKYVSPDDPMSDQVRGRKTYHIHPDRSWPEVTAIKRFDTLKEINEFLDLAEQYKKAVESGDHETANFIREEMILG